ncbi:pilus assembly protein TadE [Xylanimonas allomyrinae]|uniref:Pilus assembly protein TadE n=1 Tax=Xylanimonas allomyrinae TaxID=2509459 RepID=A0A4P6ENG6_9MICO|nr:TadE family type IV pilus minor pilin [Xylanimonas allomyrinae]QAY64242.1 pilus assembly protein TadE [Xylanimonas allomyrinae]
MTRARARDGRGRAPAGGCAERGAVTAELAVGLPVVALLLVAVLALTAASSAQLRALDAARAGARALAIGQEEAQVRALVATVGGEGAVAEVQRDGTWAVVEVSRPVGGGWFAHGPLRATARATAWVEP